MSEIGEQSSPKEYPRIENKFLTLYEQRYIGGSERVNDVFYDINQFERDYIEGEGILPEIYKKTFAEIREEDSADKVEEERKRGYLKGILPFFGESGVEVLDIGFQTVIELSERNEGVIHLLPEKIGLTNEDLKRALATLKPIGKFSRFLHFKEDQDLIRMRVKTWEEFNEI